jgi:hypothetical protein
VSRIAQSAAFAALACAGSGASAAGYEMADLGRMNCTEANAHIEKGIAAGDADAAYLAAQMVVRRVCFKPDMAAYQALLHKAADRGHLRAADDLAYATALGEGVKQDYAAAAALWRRAGTTAGATLVDDYSFGVALTLARLTRRYSGETTPLELSGTHRFGLTVDFEPAALNARRLTVARLDSTSPGGEEEVAALQRNVERDLADAWQRALRKLPPFDVGRIGSGGLTVTWQMHYHASHEAKPRLEAIESWLPH